MQHPLQIVLLAWLCTMIICGGAPVLAEPRDACVPLFFEQPPGLAALLSITNLGLFLPVPLVGCWIGVGLQRRGCWPGADTVHGECTAIAARLDRLTRGDTTLRACGLMLVIVLVYLAALAQLSSHGLLNGARGGNLGIGCTLALSAVGVACSLWIWWQAATALVAYAALVRLTALLIVWGKNEVTVQADGLVGLASMSQLAVWVPLTILVGSFCSCVGAMIERW